MFTTQYIRKIPSGIRDGGEKVSELEVFAVKRQQQDENSPEAQKKKLRVRSFFNRSAFFILKPLFAHSPLIPWAYGLRRSHRYLQRRSACFHPRRRYR